MIVLFVYDRSEASAKALTSLVAAVARARSEGMFVDVESQAVTGPYEDPAPSVFVDGVRASSATRNEIFDAIARAHRRRGSLPASSAPFARLETSRPKG